MSWSRRIERLVLVVLVVVTGFTAWSAQRAGRSVRELTLRVDEMEVRARMMAEAAKLQAATPLPPDMFDRPSTPAPPARNGGGGNRGGGPGPAPAGNDGSADGGRRPGPGANAKARVPPVPGANVLSHLYDAADTMAVKEDWDPETYDEVASVFEETTTAMVGLWEELKAGQVNVGQARQRALDVRNDAQDRLAAVLGEDGLERLKAEIRDDLPAGLQNR
ncbi:MAG: hypothetical protein H6733_13615 [Alphaproteobacteria bacterium]|nr:hypothetical protein [Alphaproteobacteria bacterium]